MKPRSAIKSDLFAAESRVPKIDSLGDPLVKIRCHVPDDCMDCCRQLKIDHLVWSILN